MTPALSDADIWNIAPVESIGKGFQFISPTDTIIQEGEEVFLTYGSHPNRTLFVEYGFVNKLLHKREITDGEVDVQDIVESLILEQEFGTFVQSILEDEGYWGNWTLYYSAESAGPSWRLITALRLHHLVISSNEIDEDTIQPWHDVIGGRQEIICDENELAWRWSLITFCDALITRAQARLHSLKKEDSMEYSGNETWLLWMRENIGVLWREELLVAEAVKQCTMRGDDF